MSTPPDDPPPAASDLAASLARLEQVLGDIRGQLEALSRARRHREFSPARLCGVVLQVLAAAFVVLAGADWIYQAPPATQLVKLLFSLVVQLGALTAFLLARDAR